MKLRNIAKNPSKRPVAIMPSREGELPPRSPEVGSKWQKSMVEDLSSSDRMKFNITDRQFKMVSDQKELDDLLDKQIDSVRS